MHVVSSASQLFLEFFLETVFVPGNNSQSSCLSRTLLWVTPSETSVETEDVEKPPATKLNLMIIPQRVVRRNKTWNVCELCDPWHAVQQLNSTCFGLKTRIWTMGSCRVHWYGIYAAQWFYACLFPWKNGCQSENSVRNIHQTHDATKPRIENIYIDAKTGHCKTDFL